MTARAIASPTKAAAATPRPMYTHCASIIPAIELIPPKEKPCCASTKRTPATIVMAAKAATMLAPPILILVHVFELLTLQQPSLLGSLNIGFVPDITSSKKL
jgi:hypothetical protein